MSTDKVIIGIHGLLNKPPKHHLENWWKQAISEGLQKNQSFNQNYQFELAYWADVRYEMEVEHQCFATAEDPMTCIDDPYVSDPGETLPKYEDGRLQGLRDTAGEWIGRGIDKSKDLIGLGSPVEILLGVTLEDLGDYYEKADIRRAIRDSLKTLLKKHQNASVLLFAHSMGSIIAYDVLREMSRENPDYKLEHLATMGSPLGLPTVSSNIRTEFGENKTPENVLRWSNFSDPKDKVALDCRLGDEYHDHNGIKVVDHFIQNTYVDRNGKSNNHKSYGYLRAPEVSDVIASHLA